MDIHPPTGKVESIKGYLVHLSMVVLGILVALGLDGVRESFRERELVRHSIDAMRAEVGSSKKSLTAVLDNYAKARPVVEDLRSKLETAIQKEENKQPVGAIENDSDTSLEINVPLLSTGAWQAAVATQALAHMDFKQATDWSSLYAFQNQVQLFQNDWIGIYGKLEPLTHITPDEDLAQLHEQLHLTREILMRMTIMQGNWKILLTRIDGTLGTSDAK